MRSTRKQRASSIERIGEPGPTTGIPRSVVTTEPSREQQLGDYNTMNTNQRIERSAAFQGHMKSVQVWGALCIPDFIRVTSPPPRKLPRVNHRITRGWTTRDELIENRQPTTEIPF